MATRRPPARSRKQTTTTTEVGREVLSSHEENVLRMARGWGVSPTAPLPRKAQGAVLAELEAMERALIARRRNELRASAPSEAPREHPEVKAKIVSRLKAKAEPRAAAPAAKSGPRAGTTPAPAPARSAKPRAAKVAAAKSRRKPSSDR